MNKNPDNIATDKAITEFMDAWTIDTAQTKDFFMQCYAFIKNLTEIDYEFIARPSISYSLRASIIKSKKPLFVMIDIIDDEPDNRWLSICFYANALSDPHQLGDFVPNGLFNEDALCFDVENADTRLHLYILASIKEAYGNSML